MLTAGRGGAAPDTVRPSELAAIGQRSHIRIMNLDLTNEETAALVRELDGII
jgi:hypothetical protein